MNVIARGITAKGFYSSRILFCIFSRFSDQHLLRQGREAVIVPHELDVVSSEISEEAPAQAGDMVRGTIYETVTVFLKKKKILVIQPCAFVTSLRVVFASAETL